MISDNIKISAAVITASDSRSIDDDVSGDTLKALLEEHGAEVIHHSVVPDDLELLRDELIAVADRSDIDLVITTGGTGLGPRDNTPEATLQTIDREVPGIADAIRTATARLTPTSILSRGVAGTRNRTLIVNLPGSPKAVTECFAVLAPILNHAVRMVTGDTNH